MPKAAKLDIDLSAPAQTPPAATGPRTAPRTVKQTRRESEPPKNDTPVNFRWPAAEAKAMKKAALEADMTMQAFMLSCFHAFLKARK